MNRLKTKRRIEIERTREAVYREYLQLMEKGAMKCKAYEYIARKHGCSSSYVTKIVLRKRKEAAA